jgi:hypothetical protein
LYYSAQGFVCCGCSLEEKKETEMNTPIEAIGHLKKHVKHGDLVPEYAFKRLISEAMENIVELTNK